MTFEHPASPTSFRRGVRSGATIILLAVVLAGTFWGSDDHFPFGPFRMYSVANKTDGAISVPALEATTTSGQRIEMDFEETGLRRAEVEGQMDRLLADPSLLRHLATSYERLQEDADPLTELRLLEEINYLRDGEPYRTERRVLATWRRP